MGPILISFSNSIPSTLRYNVVTPIVHRYAIIELLMLQSLELLYATNMTTAELPIYSLIDIFFNKNAKIA